MAKNKNNQAKAVPATPVKNPGAPKQPVRNAAPVEAKDSFISRYSEWLVVCGICLLTYLFYSTILNNKLTNWDDLGYIITNPVIKDNSAEGIRKMFSLSDIFKFNNGHWAIHGDFPVMGNYHPLTILIYAIEYSYYGLEPWIYHFDSILFHILVTIAVYFFVRVLTKRPVAAGIAALLFGLHPMHVESVAWAAGRKDILYGLFYILAMMTYIFYLRATSQNKRIMWYVATFLLFFISLLAKSVGVVFPVMLFLLDYLEGRQFFTTEGSTSLIGNPKTGKFNYRILLDKVPLLILSYTFGIISVNAQSKIGALGTLDVHFTFMERIGLGFYALCTYLWKTLVPVGMCNFYPYPMKDANDALPAGYYLYVVLVLGVLFALWKYARKNKMLLFGLGFFLINIVLLLQFIPVGGCIMSDRYTYIPYLGLFVIAGWVISGYFKTKEKKQTGYILVGVIVAYSLVLGFVTTDRSKDWYDSISLWKDDIEKHPSNPVSWFYLGQEYYNRYEAAVIPADQKRLVDSAQFCFGQSIQRKPDYINPIICLAELQRSTNQIDSAKKTYFMAMQINESHTANKVQNKDESVYLGLAVIYSIKRQFDSAEYCFKEALKIKEYFPEAYSNYANFLDIVGRPDSSLKYYAVAISQDPDAVIPYMNRARINMVERNLPDIAIKDYDKVLALKPEKADAYYARSKCYAAKGDKKRALQDVEKAKSLGYPGIDPTYYQSLK